MQSGEGIGVWKFDTLCVLLSGIHLHWKRRGESTFARSVYMSTSVDFYFNGRHTEVQVALQCCSEVSTRISWRQTQEMLHEELVHYCSHVDTCNSLVWWISVYQIIGYGLLKGWYKSCKWHCGIADWALQFGGGRTRLSICLQALLQALCGAWVLKGMFPFTPCLKVLSSTV